MNKKIIVLLVCTLIISSFVVADEFEDSLNAALNAYKNGKNGEALSSLYDAVMLLHNKKEFKVGKSLLCEAIGGLSLYKARENYTFKTTEKVYIYTEVEGYGIEKKGNTYGFKISMDITLTDEKGKEVFHKRNFSDYNKYFELPEVPFFMQNVLGALGPGKYKLEILIKDNIKKAFETITFDFKIE